MKNDKDKKKLVVPFEIITSDEYDKRVKAYEKIYEDARKSKAFERYQKMREAWKAKKWDEVKKLKEEAHKEVMENEREDPLPYPDPDIAKMKGELGVKEFWEQQIKKAIEDGKEIVYPNPNVKDVLDIPISTPDF